MSSEFKQQPGAWQYTCDLCGRKAESAERDSPAGWRLIRRGYDMNALQVDALHICTECLKRSIKELLDVWTDI